MPACHNANDTQTISGPAEAVAMFVEQMRSEGVFAREIETTGIAFHSPFMEKVAPAMRLVLEKVCILYLSLIIISKLLLFYC